MAKPSRPGMKIDRYVEKSLTLAIGLGRARVMRKLEEQLRTEGCSYLQALVLVAIFFEAPSAVTPSCLARSLRATPGNLSHAITALEKSRRLKRVLNPRDARSYQLVLLPEGKRCALRLVGLIDRVETVLEERLGAAESERVRSALSALA